MISFDEFQQQVQRLCAAFRKSVPDTDRVKAMHALTEHYHAPEVMEAFKLLMAESSYPSRAAFKRALEESKTRQRRSVSVRPIEDWGVASDPEYSAFRMSLIMRIMLGEYGPQEVADCLENARAYFPLIEQQEIAHWRNQNWLPRQQGDGSVGLAYCMFIKRGVDQALLAESRGM